MTLIRCNSVLTLYHPCRTCKVGNNTLIGSSTQIYDHASVVGSVIGKRCTIGPNVKITDSYIFDDTFIGADTVIDKSIIGFKVSVGKNCIINKGCLVGDDVRIGDGAQLRPYEKVATQLPPGDDDDSDLEGDELDETSTSPRSAVVEICANMTNAATLQILGKGANAKIWPMSKTNEEADSLDSLESHMNQRLMRIGTTTVCDTLWNSGADRLLR
jgi:translation initiation factor eIF-2B subunit epsilon